MMNRPNLMYKQGGLNDEGGEIDEVSGNRVPVGGTKKGVRDDIDVNMSAGEWVADEATTRYHGLKTFLGMRDEALMGMKKMEAMGLMGNSDEATLPDDMPFGMADLLLVEIDEKNGKQRELNMQDGGFVSGQEGETISLEGQQQATPTKARRKVTFDEVMAEAKMEFKEYRNAEGQSLMVPFIGGVPLYPIPEGYTLYTGEGSEIGETELPDTGAEAITPSARDDDDDDTNLTAYRATKKDTSIQWDTLSDEDFLKEANARNGFGRNLAMGVASLISPFAAVGMAGLMRMEDNKVLAMARTRLANLPKGSAQRAQYEKMIEAYEARGKGLFGGIIGKIVDTLGNIFGSTEEQKKKGQNANLVGSSGLVVGKYSANGQITEAGTAAVNEGIVDGISKDQYLQAITDLESSDPEVKKAAQNILAKHIGQELGNFVDPSIMNAVQTGIGGRTPEQTRVDLVNIAYQPATVVKEQLDALTQGQKDFLGYTSGIDPSEALAVRQNAERTIADPNAGLQEVQQAEQALANLETTPVSNYLDVVDFGREQVAEILPTDTPRLEVQNRFIDEPQGTMDRVGEYGLTEESRAASRERREDGTAIGMLDTSDSTRAPITRDFTADALTVDGQQLTTPSTQTQEQARENQISSLVSAGVDRNLAEAAIPTAIVPEVTVTEQPDVEALEGPEAAAGAVTSVISPIPAQPAVTTTELPATTTTDTLPKEDDPAYPEYYAKRMLPSPFEGVSADGTGTVTGTTTDQTTEALGTSVSPFAAGQQGALDTTTPSPFAEGQQGAAEATTITLPQFDSSTVKEIAEANEDAYMAEAFGGAAGPTATTFADTQPLELADVVPDTGTPATTTGAAMSFDDAFAAARAEEARLGISSGTSQFEFNGQMYSTATAEEAAATAQPQAQEVEQKGKYDPTASALSGGYTTNTLSEAEQDAFDYAVDSGNSAVADHYASVNRLRNKQDEFAASGFDETLGRSLGLSQTDMDQAREFGGSVQTAINEGRATDDGNPFTPVQVTDPTPTTSTGGRDDDSGSTTTTSTSSRDTNIASSGRSETQIQADINAALEASGDVWTSELNDLVAERDSARSNEGSSTPAASSGSDDGGGGGGGASNNSGCVIATHAVASGAFQVRDKANAVEWCKKTLHDKWWGETMRKGYRYLGRKHIENGTAETVYKEFKECIEWANGKRPFNIKIASRYYYRAAQTFFVGLFVKEDV